MCSGAETPAGCRLGGGPFCYLKDRPPAIKQDRGTARRGDGCSAAVLYVIEGIRGDRCVVVAEEISRLSTLRRMEFLDSKKPASSFSHPSTDAHQKGLPAEASGVGPVTSCLHLRGSPREEDGGRGRRALDRDLVLRRIRHHRRATQTQDAAAPQTTSSLRFAGGEMWRGGWLDEDAFSSP
ncbi:hypothetical protein Taro_042091 [Colocasia esculenta]|uniref:Uncharacterized protein n=1 Tax=Colocasia esculenta TaxID=4460 RepID=A0A843WD23_COLES|nr:hypothetical protein [Colocasia esculenta]